MLIYLYKINWGNPRGIIILVEHHQGGEDEDVEKKRFPVYRDWRTLLWEFSKETAWG